MAFDTSGGAGVYGDEGLLYESHRNVPLVGAHGRRSIVCVSRDASQRCVQIETETELVMYKSIY